MLGVCVGWPMSGESFARCAGVRRLAGLALVWACLAMAACARRVPTDELGEEGASTTPMIVVVKDELSLRMLREMCTVLSDRTAQGAALFPDLDKDCNLQGACHHIYNASIKGVSGDFTSEALQRLRKCIPDGIKYIETDGKVQKEEHNHDLIPLKMDLDVSSEGIPVMKLTHRGEVSPGLEKLKALNESDMEPLVYAFGEENETKVKKMDEAELAQLVSNPGLKSQRVHVALWNLDRLDQQDLPLDKTFRYGTDDVVGTGRGVTIYVLDSGVMPGHREFEEWGGSGTRAKYGFDFVDEDPISEDCDGHGTHVASTAIGKSVGVAKQAKVVAVRVLDCAGSGNISTTVAGLDWVANNYEGPAVVAMSLGVSIGRWSRSLEDAVKSLINTHNLPVIVASGNSGVDSCFVAPANVPETITVAASNLDTKFGETSKEDKEGIYRWSNTGKCVDIFAPGVDIYAACGGVGRCSVVTDSAYTWASGTSMAVPHVAGVAAMYLGEYPQASPAEVKQALVGMATTGKIESQFMRSDTPNRILYSNVFGSSRVTQQGR